MTDKRKNNGRKAGTKNKVQGEIAKKPKKLGSVKKDNSDYSALNKDEFLKVRPGETQKEWEQRTSKKRILSLDNNLSKKNKEIHFLPNGSIRFKRKNIVGMARQTKTIIQGEYLEKTNDFMKYYTLIMRWASLHYGIAKDDIEIGFYFYDHQPFSPDEFNELCMQLGTVRGVFARFYKSGYVVPLEIGLGDYRKSKELKIYSLSREFQYCIAFTYKVMARLVPAFEVKGRKKVLAEPIIKELKEMYEQSNEIIKGLRKPATIRFRNEEE